MRAWIFGVLSLSLLAGCKSTATNNAATVAEELKMRPIVAVAPVMDSSRSDLGWEVSDELTDLLFQRLVKRDKFYLASMQRVKADLKKGDLPKDPFEPGMGWMKRVFQGSEFVVFVELIEHAERHRLGDQMSALAHIEETSADLNISARIRAIDLRESSPKITLQEMLHVNHHIPRQFTRKNFYQVSWEDENFAISPLGIAHADLVKTITERLEEYLLRAKTPS